MMNPMVRNAQIPWLRLLFFCSLILWTVFCPGCSRDQAYKKPLTTVRIQPAEERYTVEGLYYSATILPHTQINLAFKVGGYIEEILQVRGVDGRMRNAQEGDFIARGAVLAKVREDDYVTKLDVARARLAEATAGSSNASVEFRRETNLFKADSVTEKDYDNARTRFELTRAQVDAEKARLNEAEITLRDCSLKAPMPLLILKRNIELGTLVSHGATGFVVADTSSVKATFGVPDMILNHLTLGKPQTVTTEAFPDREFRGVISAISPAADSRSRIFEVEVTLPNPGNSLKSGMIVALALGKGKLAKPIIVVPLNAIVRPKDNPSGYAVYVVGDTDGKSVVRIRNIHVGQIFGNTVAVTEGVRAGERIIVTGATLVVDGEQVSIAP